MKKISAIIGILIYSFLMAVNIVNTVSAHNGREIVSSAVRVYVPNEGVKEVSVGDGSFVTISMEDLHEVDNNFMNIRYVIHY